jgi:hypothetical protein
MSAGGDSTGSVAGGDGLVAAPADMVEAFDRLRASLPALVESLQRFLAVSMPG